MAPKIREPAVAGTFYPDDRRGLNEKLEQLFSALPETTPQRATNGIIVPHAGYTYSGKIAASGFATLRTRHFNRAIILGPSHHVSFYGVSAAPFDKYRTPLGDVDVAADACDQLLRATPLITQRSDVHKFEHAVEVELPFIQALSPECRIVPLIFGLLSPHDIHEMAHSIAPLWDEDTVLIISSDFVHYGKRFDFLPFPATDAPEKLRDLDHRAIRRIIDGDVEQFLGFTERSAGTICGRIPIAVLLAIIADDARADAVTEISYGSSSDVSEDYSHSVGYAALAVGETTAPRHADRKIDTGLSSNDSSLLINLAYQSIRAGLDNHTLTPPVDTPLRFRQPGNVFVTLRIGQTLRGCIGSLHGREPLQECVIANAAKAAFEDPRFPPLSHDEFENITIEISLLTEPRPIADIAEFRLGMHGIILEFEKSRAVFLPDVATENGWDKESTLEHLSRKAGLAPGHWRRNGVRFSIFNTIHIYSRHT